MVDYSQYVDTFKNVYEAVPVGKVFRIVFDATTKSMRIISRDFQQFKDLQEAFSVKNDAAFFT